MNANQPPEPGDPITHVVTIGNTDRSQLFYMTWFRALSTAGEGSTWIRGHHAEDSEVGRALLAAWALNQC